MSSPAAVFSKHQEVASITRDGEWRLIGLLDELNVHLEAAMESELIGDDSTLARWTKRESAEDFARTRRLRRVSEDILIRLCAAVEVNE